MEQTPWYVSLILSWLPLFLFLASALWVGRRIARELATRDGKSIAQLMDQYGRELKRSNDMLEQAVADLRTRLEDLEKRK
jgi:hypothetical protein